MKDEGCGRGGLRDAARHAVPVPGRGGMRAFCAADKNVRPPFSSLPAGMGVSGPCRLPPCVLPQIGNLRRGFPPSRRIPINCAFQR